MLSEHSHTHTHTEKAMFALQTAFQKQLSTERFNSYLFFYSFLCLHCKEACKKKTKKKKRGSGLMLPVREKVIVLSRRHV